MWAAIVKGIQEKETLIWENLQETFVKVSDPISPEFVIKLYKSVPRRLNNVLKLKGTFIE